MNITPLITMVLTIPIIIIPGGYQLMLPPLTKLLKRMLKEIVMKQEEMKMVEEALQAAEAQ